MRILIVSNAYPPNFIGGAEFIAHYQAKAFQDGGHEVLVFAGEGQVPGSRHQVVRESFEGVATWRIFLSQLDFDARSGNFHRPEIDAQFKEALAAFRPDVVHVHNLVGLSVGILELARAAGAVTVVTFHDNWGFCLRNTLMLDDGSLCDDRRACARCLPSIRTGSGWEVPIELRQDYFSHRLEVVDWFVSPSWYLARNYLEMGFPRSAMNVIWNGVDTGRFAGIRPRREPDRVRFSFIGYLGEHKGVALLLRACALLRHPAVRVNLIGTGHQRPALEELARQLEIGPLVRFWGKVENRRIEGVLAETDVLVLPSVWPENQPVSITEAMAAGIPVIGSEAGGIPELIEDGVTGFMFRLGDAEALAGRMRRFLDEPELASRIGEAARTRIADNSFARATQRLEAIYARGHRADAVHRSFAVGVRGQVGDQALGVVRTLGAGGRALRPVRFLPEEWLDGPGDERLSARWFLAPDPAREPPASGGLPVVITDAPGAPPRPKRPGHLACADAETTLATFRVLIENRDLAAGAGGHALGTPSVEAE